MIVGVVGVGGESALEESSGVVPLPAGGDGLVVDHLRKRKPAGDECEGFFGFGISAGVEAREAKIEVGFKRATVGWGNARECGGGVIVVPLGVLGFAKGEECGGVGGSFLDSEPEDA